MSENSPRMLWPYPEQHQDPWYEVFVDLIRAMDASGFAAREDRNLILAGGGTLSWLPGSTGLTWTDSFAIFSPSTGFFTRIVANSLVPADGQVIRAEIVRHPGQNVNVAAEVANIALNTDDSLILGLRVGTNFIFRNGFLIQDGTVIDAVDFFGGGGGGGGGPDNFSYKVVVAGKTVTIPENQQMVVSGGITIDGVLDIDGELALIP